MTKVRKKVIQGAPAWVVTFGDLMSLLLTFFVLLLSFQAVESSQKYQEMAGSIRNAFGLGFQTNITPPAAMDLIKLNDDLTMNATKLAREIHREIIPHYPLVEKKLERPEVVRRKNRIVLRFNGEAIFPSGRSRIDPRFHAFLDAIAVKATAHSAGIIIEAHTDNVPLKSPMHRSNSELSVSRAGQVLSYLRGVAELNPKMLLAVGKGPHEPVHRNNTEKGRSMNRRIEIQFVQSHNAEGSIRLGAANTPTYELGGEKSQ